MRAQESREQAEAAQVAAANAAKECHKERDRVSFARVALSQTISLECSNCDSDCVLSAPIASAVWCCSLSVCICA